MSPINCVTYHISVPTFGEVQAVVPFDIDPLDRRTAAWYLLGAVYGRDHSGIWEGAEAQRGVDWDVLNVSCIDGPAIGGIALSLSGEFVDGAQSFDLAQSLAMLSAEQMTGFLAAALLFQHIADGTWGPTAQALQAKEEARIAALPTGAPAFDDSSERTE